MVQLVDGSQGQGEVFSDLSDVGLHISFGTDHIFHQFSAGFFSFLDLPFALGLGVGNEDFRVSLCIFLHIFSGILGQLKGIGHGFGNAFIVGQFRFHLVHLLCHFTMFSVDLFIICNDLLQEIIHFFLAVAAQGCFGKSLVMDIHWCNHR